jgi:hypothetical protein
LRTCLKFSGQGATCREVDLWKCLGLDEDELLDALGALLLEGDPEGEHGQLLGDLPVPGVEARVAVGGGPLEEPSLRPPRIGHEFFAMNDDPAHYGYYRWQSPALHLFRIQGHSLLDQHFAILLFPQPARPQSLLLEHPEPVGPLLPQSVFPQQSGHSELRVQVLQQVGPYLLVLEQHCGQSDQLRTYYCSPALFPAAHY